MTNVLMKILISKSWLFERTVVMRVQLTNRKKQQPINQPTNQKNKLCFNTFYLSQILKLNYQWHKPKQGHLCMY